MSDDAKALRKARPQIVEALKRQLEEEFPIPPHVRVPLPPRVCKHGDTTCLHGDPWEKCPHRVCEVSECNPKNRRNDPPLVSSEVVDGKKYAIGIDVGLRDDVTAYVVFERDEDGRLRLTSATTTEPNGIVQHFGMIFRGWKCRACQVFVSEEKELIVLCRSCGAPRPK
jgi:hypothetical protein